MKVDSICILGGGTSGFSMASLLAKYREVSKLNFDINVVYSEKIGKIGVGESTLLSINDLFRYLDVNDSEWMSECNATYKTSIRFENFYKRGRYFHYPFGDIFHNTFQDIRSWFILKDKNPEVFTPEISSSYFIPHTLLNEKNKLTKEEFLPGYNFDNISAYHFDTHLLSKFLKSYAEKKGVKFIDDTFLDASLDKSGYVKSINCENNTISADLFIDCSGFNSLLLGKTLNEEYISFEDTLLNHRVIRAKIPYYDKEEQLKNYTNCIALNNGWLWEIPLWDSLSIGYVHSLKFSTENEIENEFKEHCKKYKIDFSNIDYEIINYKTGRYKRGWVKNVVAVGLSYGFLEPLESTGIATMLSNSFRLLECLSKRDMFYTNIDRDIFNTSVGKYEIDRLRSFIEMHYFLSSRDDSEYWQYVTNEIDYGNDNSNYDVFINKTVEERNYHVPNVTEGIPFIVSGMNYSHFSKAFIVSDDNPNMDIEIISEQFQNNIKNIEEIIENYSSTYQFLKDNIYNK